MPRLPPRERAPARDATSANRDTDLDPERDGRRSAIQAQVAADLADDFSFDARLPWSTPERAAKRAATLRKRLKTVAETARALDRGGERERARAARLRQCGEIRAVRLSTTDQWLQPAPWFCRDRVCPDCAERKYLGQLIAATDVFAKAPGAQIWFIGLTQRRPPNEPLISARARLSKAFRRLRERVAFSRPVIAWAARFERTRRPDGWHEHLHLVVAAYDLDEAALNRAWRGASRDPEAEDIHFKRLQEHEIRDHLAYMTKPEVGTADELLTMAADLKGLHEVGLSQNVRRAVMAARKAWIAERRRGTDVDTVTVAELRRRARGGEELARRVLDGLASRPANGALRRAEEGARSRPRRRPVGGNRDPPSF